MSSSSRSDRFLLGLSHWVLRGRWLIVIMMLVVCAFSVHYMQNHLGVHTNTAEMLSPDLPFQQSRFKMEREFPQFASALIIVVDAPTPEETALAAQALQARIEALPEQFQNVFIGDDNPFFQRQALLYLDLDELEKLVDKLTDAQPFIGYLVQHYHLAGLFDIIGKALDDTTGDLPMDLDPLLHALSETIAAQRDHRLHYLSWQTLLTPEGGKMPSRRKLVIAKPQLVFSEIMPAEQAVGYARAVTREIAAQFPNVTMRITGETALEHEELESVAQSTVISSAVSFLLVCITLWVALRSVRLLFATILTLIAGLILTAGFAAVAIGHLNIISVAFAVLYIGLGVDYAIHLCLRYRECLRAGFSQEQAITHSMETVGVSLTLCAITTAIGFFAFIPTDYLGVSELGIISGVGIFIGLTISLTLLPALLKLLPLSLRHATPPPPASRLLAYWNALPFRHARMIRVLALLLGVLGIFELSRLRFDSNPVNLRDPNSESVVAFKELLQSNTDSPFALAALASDLASAERLAAQVKTLPSVHETITLTSFVPDQQEEKLEIIENLALIMGHELDELNRPVAQSDVRAALAMFATTLQNALAREWHNANPDTLQHLLDEIRRFQTYADGTTEPETTYARLEHAIFYLLPYTLQQLRTALSAYAFTLDDLPDYIRRDWVSPSGLYRVLITPREDLNDPTHLKTFVREVQAIDTSITGLPVSDTASGEAVVRSFVQAFTNSLVLIVVLLLIMLRNVHHTLLVIGPLLLAAILTGAANVLLDNPFNFANIIVLPLLLGMGVDSGIHMVHRLRIDGHREESLLATSTARGVFYSALTTLCSFSSLTFTPHRGIASMGLLLALGISFTLLCALLVLPAFSGKHPPSDVP